MRLPGLTMSPHPPPPPMFQNVLLPLTPCNPLPKISIEAHRDFRSLQFLPMKHNQPLALKEHFYFDPISTHL